VIAIGRQVFDGSPAGLCGASADASAVLVEIHGVRRGAIAAGRIRCGLARAVAAKDREIPSGGRCCRSVAQKFISVQEFRLVSLPRAASRPGRCFARREIFSPLYEGLANLASWTLLAFEAV
jgi:hypothetical protein